MRTGPKISAAMESSYNLLIKSKKIEEVEGKIKLLLDKTGQILF
jgi:hypothetical protein